MRFAKFKSMRKTCYVGFIRIREKLILINQKGTNRFCDLFPFCLTNRACRIHYITMQKKSTATDVARWLCVLCREVDYIITLICILNYGFHLICGVFLHIIGDMHICVHREACIRVSEHLRYRFDINSRLERERCEGVP